MGYGVWTTIIASCFSLVRLNSEAFPTLSRPMSQMARFWKRRPRRSYTSRAYASFGNSRLPPRSQSRRQCCMILAGSFVLYFYVAIVTIIISNERISNNEYLHRQKDWEKVYAGLIRLFQGEVLNKLPVVQHLAFGSILKREW